MWRAGQCRGARNDESAAARCFPKRARSGRPYVPSSRPSGGLGEWTCGPCKAAPARAPLIRTHARRVQVQARTLRARCGAGSRRRRGRARGRAGRARAAERPGRGAAGGRPGLLLQRARRAGRGAVAAAADLAGAGARAGCVGCMMRYWGAVQGSAHAAAAAACPTGRAFLSGVRLHGSRSAPLCLPCGEADGASLTERGRYAGRTSGRGCMPLLRVMRRRGAPAGELAVSVTTVRATGAWAASRCRV